MTLRDLILLALMRPQEPQSSVAPLSLPSGAPQPIRLPEIGSGIGQPKRRRGTKVAQSRRRSTTTGNRNYV